MLQSRRQRGRIWGVYMSELVKRLTTMAKQADSIAQWCDETAQKIQGLEFILDGMQAQLDDFAGLLRDMTNGELVAVDSKEAKTSPAHPASRPIIPPEKIEQGIAQGIAQTMAARESRESKDKSHG